MLLAIVAGAVLVIGGMLAFLLLRDKSADQQASHTTTPASGPKSFVMTTESRAIKYAGNTVYDACNLISFDTIRSTVNNYQKLLDMNGTAEKPSEPLTIEHRYVDRDIASPLGKDGKPRPTSTKIGKDKAIDANSFISESDSNCWYGQGKGLSIGTGKIFAKVYVTQKPTPLSGDLLRYLATLKPAASADGMTAYVESKTDGGGFFTSIIINKQNGAVAFVKTASRELARKATIEVSEKLVHTPAAPMNMAYPLGWTRMPNPCALFTADDFRQTTSRPASVLAEDILGMNEIGGRMMQRSCERLELERLDGSPISKSNIVVRMGKDESAAKTYVDFVKDNPQASFDIQSIKQKVAFADDAYLMVLKNGGKTTGYEFNMRIGQAVIVLVVNAEGKTDSSADAFVGRILPLAQKVADRYRDVASL